MAGQSVETVQVNVRAVADNLSGFTQAQGAAKNLNKQMVQVGATGRGMTRQMRAGFGQLGHQIQDVAVQLQMGQNAFLVFAQQGSQIASLLGPFGAMAGAVMAIGGAIAMSLIPNLGEATDSAEDLLNRLKDLQGLPQGLESSFGIQFNQAQIKADELAIKQQRKSLQGLMSDREELRKQVEDAQKGAGFVSNGGVLGFKQVDIEAVKNEIEDLDLKISQANLTILEHGASIRLAEQSLDEYKQKAAGDFIPEGYIDRAIEQIEEQNKEIFKRSEELLREHNKARNEIQRMGLIGEEINIKDSFVRQQELIEEYANKQIITEQEKAEAIKRINSNMQKSAAGEFSKGIDALGNYNKKAFKIAKGVKTAEAIMNTYAGANQALAAYPPPFSYIAAAGQIAFGMAQVAQIKSQSFAGRAAGGMVQAGQPYMVGEMGKEMFIPNTGGRIVNNRDTEAGLGTTNINFSITTVDAKGFGELLTSRRGQIVNMVNQAMHDKGRVGVTA